MSFYPRHFVDFGRRQLLAAFWLVVYLWMGTPLAPVTAAVIACLDGEHGVQISSHQGGTKVVLRHAGPTLRGHAHRLVSTALVWLADGSPTATSDHVLSFQKAQIANFRDFIESMSVRVPTGTCLPSVAPLVGLLAGFTSLETPLLAIPPPSWSVSVVRSTVFLI
ncbi:MAG: hypothetical protein JNN07_04040 [Verrucomicrobiales bacterium]|nr:hypothetical protein [Verrucomicrobiales bacterium]